MPKRKEPYTLRFRKGVWHFWYYDKGGQRRSRSTGETSKTAAIEVARQFLKQQEGDMLVSVRPPPSPNHVLEWVPPSPHKGYYLEWVEPPPKPTGFKLAWVPILECPTLSEYAKDWFTGRGPYELRKQAEGKPLAEGTLDLNRLLLTVHLLPRVGSLRLDEFTTARIEKFKLELYEEVKHNSNSQGRKIKSGRQVNEILSVLRLILKNALHEGLLTTNPFSEVKPVQQNNRRQRKIFTPQEARQLLNPQTVRHIWGNSETAKAAWLATMLAAFTGARRNEILGLEWDRVHLDTSPPYLMIDRQLNRAQTDTAPTKAKDARTPPLPSFLADILQSLPRSSRWVIQVNGQPLTLGKLRVCHRKALEHLGISAQEQKQRGLSFHAWRSWFNTTLRPLVNETDLRRVIGHRSEEMTDHYDNPDVASLSSIAQALENLWGVNSCNK